MQLNNDNVIEQIPKIAFTFWEGNQFSFLHYMTIHSFATYNPDFKVIIYSSTNLGDVNKEEWSSSEHSLDIVKNLDNIHRLKKLPNVEFKICDFELELGIKNIKSSVYKSDILRIYKLYEHGGIWMDFDILFTKKLPDHMLYIPKNSIMISSYENVFPIGFIVSHKKNKILEYLKNSTQNVLDQNLNDKNYQKFGTIIWTPIKNIHEFKEKIIIFPSHYVYPYIWNEVNKMYYSNEDQIREDTFGLHWYNGSEISKKYINELDMSLLDPSVSIFNRELYKTYKETKATYTKVSIVMTAYNRKSQCIFTLKTISNSKYKNFTEIIIVDDGSDDENRFDEYQYLTTSEAELFKSLNIKVIRIEPFQKMWKNPCIPYNIGLKKAEGEIVIIQNSEVCHIGDCIEFVVKNLQHGDWLTLNCFGLGSYDHNYNLEDIYKLQFNTNAKMSIIRDFIYHLEKTKPNNKSAISSFQGWLNHYEKHFVAYHYFGALFRKDLNSKLSGGFCNDYANGICFDDNDLIKYLIHNNFRFITNKFNNNNPFVIHQYHVPLSNIPKEKLMDYHAINGEIFKKRMKIIKSNTCVNIHKDFTMPKPHLVDD